MASGNINKALNIHLFEIVTVFIVAVIFFNVFNVDQHIFDYRRTSAILTTSYAIALAGIVCVCVCVCT
jgi:hypothetical protein